MLGVTKEGAAGAADDLGAIGGEDPVALLVGPGKKYKDIQALAASRLEADKHIARIEDENRRIHEELVKRTADTSGVKNLTDLLTSTLKLGPQNQPATPAGSPPSPTAGSTQVDPRAIEGLVTKILDERVTERERTANAQTVYAGLTKQYGSDNDAKTAVTKRSAELGMSPAKLMDLARTSPQAFFSIMGINPGPAATTHAGTDVSTSIQTTGRTTASPAAATGSTGTAKPGTFAYYEGLRKAEPKKYWTAEVQKNLYNDLNANPDFFWGRESQ
jgi:hypothetical protein